MDNNDIMMMWMETMDNRVDAIQNAGRETFNALKLVHEQQLLMIETEKLLNMRIELLETELKEIRETM